jgi:hypothetical protein
VVGKRAGASPDQFLQRAFHAGLVALCLAVRAAFFEDAAGLNPSSRIPSAAAAENPGCSAPASRVRMPASWYGNSIRCMESALSGVVASVGAYHGRRVGGKKKGDRMQAAIAASPWIEKLLTLQDEPTTVSPLVVLN